jgi:hypothetical protein
MKKTVFNRSSIPSKGAHNMGCSINVNPKGQITFSKELTELLKSKTVQFIQDEEREKDWYIEATNDSNAIEVRAQQNGQYIIQSSYLAREILRSVEMAMDRPVRFMVATKPIEENTYAILTKKPIVKEDKEEAE